MSDSAQVLAARVEDREATRFAALAVGWLVERRIIEAMPTDSGLGSLAHRPGPNAAEIVVEQRAGVMDFRALRTNGMQVEHGPRATLVMGGDEMPVFACPSCKQELDTDEIFPLLEEIPNLFAPPPEVPCRACGMTSAVNDLTVSSGVFANLTLRFWNWWPIKESFVAELAAKLGTKVTVLADRV